MRGGVFGLAALAALGACAPVHDFDNGSRVYQQPEGVALDPDAAPRYGEVSLTAGFLPDPHVILLESGAADTRIFDNASALGGACRGILSGPPHIRLNYAAGSAPLYISAESESDATLVVHTPDGAWVCADDGGDGFNPALTFSAPESGRYAIWVGNKGARFLPPATLYISETGYHDARP